ncbi:hypothetical protein LTR53_011507 [Teratosphaeriaceae sp. CCFEE 6253]|nr:hypothetical protein LTR53_011507 [Teratosphaeriaceae sp. CCFEE 6253]
MAGFKLVALISGGKDSFFSILHCIANGHEVIALANLHPSLNSNDNAAEDTDSFMYQTIGHAVIPLYAEALGLPLYRQEIIGSATNQSRDYGYTAATEAGSVDETESLVPLLLKVKEAHPDLNAVSTGAILSDYQRTRVESVALRLGLTPLAYLWQWPSLPPHTETSLLEDMAAVGQDSRIIKTASGALDETFLWQNVADHRIVGRLIKASARFGSLGDGAVLGEGGEYETLAVQGPSPLWKGRIVVDEAARLVVPGEAGSFSLRMSSPRVIMEKPQGRVEDLHIPPLMDDLAQRMLHRLSEPTGSEPQRTPAQLPAGVTDRGSQEPSTISAAHGTASYFCRTGPGTDAAAQMHAIMEEVVGELTTSGTGISSAVYTSIILRHMADFAAVNKAYGAYFVEPNPPARITLACADVLPKDSLVMVGITCLAEGTAGIRKGLHVQSRSYWAPANIGPYSQAISVPTASPGDEGDRELLYIAGQIPLEPATMELSVGNQEDAPSQFAHQTVLALQHMTRIGSRMGSRAWVAAIAFVVEQAEISLLEMARMVRIAWQVLHEPPVATETEEDEDEDEDFDVWDRTQRHGHNLGRQKQDTGFDTTETSCKGAVPPLWIVRVDALPRGASVEWVGYGTTGTSGQGLEIEHLRYLLRVFGGRVDAEAPGYVELDAP